MCNCARRMATFFVVQGVKLDLAECYQFDINWELPKLKELLGYSKIIGKKCDYFLFNSTKDSPGRNKLVEKATQGLSQTCWRSTIFTTRSHELPQPSISASSCSQTVRSCSLVYCNKYECGCKRREKFRPCRGPKLANKALLEASNCFITGSGLMCAREVRLVALWFLSVATAQPHSSQP